jgi:hypothetical protein
MRLVTRVGLVVCASIVALPGAGEAQTATPPRPGQDSVTVRASSRYGASGIHEFLLGENYRDFWYQPIRVPVLDLSGYAGGLTALEEGGNAQTRNLHLRGADGKEYVFRPVYKDVLKLPDDFKNTVVEDIFSDGLSASHPAATVLPNALMEAAGVLHAEPKLYVMPDDPKLGEFRKNFAGKLGSMEEFPEDPKGGKGFGGAVDIIDSEDLLERINKDNASNRIDAHALLTARLIDVLIGDHDRHPGQWKWARRSESKDALWVPIPRDRDKAFVSYDGVLLGVARMFLPRLVKFTHIPHTAMFYNAVNFDQRLLASLTREEFDSTAEFLQRVITDSVIDAAFRSMPREYQAIRPDVKAKLRGRRNVLMKSADGFYREMFTIIDLHGSDAADKATITRQADGTVDVRLESKGVAYLDRKFEPGDTKEIRLYLQGGDDTATITGEAPRSIPLWIVGGTGANTLVDESVVGGRRGRARLYDRGGVSEASVIVETGEVDIAKKNDAGKDSTGKGEPNEPKAKKKDGGYDPDTAWNRRPVVKFQGWEVPPFRDRGSSMRPTMLIKTGRGLGFMPVLQISRRNYGFRQYPYASKTDLEVGYSTALKGWEAELKTDNRIESSRMFVTTETGVSELVAGRFAGFGNDIEIPDDRATMLAKQQQYEFTPGLGWALGLGTEITFGPIVKYTVTDSQPNTLISVFRPYGFQKFGQAGFRMKFMHESMRQVVSHGGTADELLRDDHPHGLTMEAEAAVYPATWDATSTFGSVSAVATGFVTLPLPLSPVIATRIGGQQNFGKYPYFEGAFLGGRQTVRTLPRSAYVGDAMVYGSAELRIPIASFPFILPLNTGVFGFADAGRVYVDRESPGGWHSGMGGGFWLGVLKPSTSISLTFTNQRDRRILVGTGFVF